MARILIIEDEEKISRILSLELSFEGYETAVSSDGQSGLEKALAEEWDLILLDVMLPGLNGIEVLQKFRKENTHTPIILLTARNTISNKVTGLDQGANDYITKPFSFEELFARIRANLRIISEENRNKPLEILTAGHIKLVKETREVNINNNSIELTSKEFDLLLYFLVNKNQVLSREQIISDVWGFDYAGETNIVDVYVRYLRKKINEEGSDSLIQTFHGVGYSLKEPQT